MSVGALIEFYFKLIICITIPEEPYYENFSDFSSAIYECLNDAHLKHKKELDSLLTLRFQKFNKSQIMNV
ncbi:Mobile element protein [Microcystis panniformis FACHB-1757]|uniref:Mobile element protein n=1 Tax=Microcystis panniformis FACHB-1757 TaxID=1638788 RepID=A0A0K1S1I9_9CHRO|nr:Mobile element protein [Microcystis panniformis FACHB-1757]